MIDNKLQNKQIPSTTYEILISYEKEVDVDNKLNNGLKITGFISNMVRAQITLKETRIKLYNTLAFPAVLYCSE